MPIPNWAAIPLSTGVGGDSHGEMHGRTLGLWENVKAYGAEGNDVADDTAAIQAALTEASLLVSTGAQHSATVYFPPGKYKITSTLTLAQSAVSLRGAGQLASTLRFPSGVIGLDIGDGSNTYLYNNIYDLTFTGQTFDSIGRVRYRKQQLFQIENSVFNAGDPCLSIDLGTSGRVSGCNINNSKNKALNLTNCDQLSIFGNYFELDGTVPSPDANAKHIFMSGCTDVNITGNNFSTNRWALYADTSPSPRCVFSGNVAEGVDQAMLIGPVAASSSDKWVITGNSLEGTDAGSAVAINLYGDNHLISGNRITRFATAIREWTSGGATPNQSFITGLLTDAAVPVNLVGTETHAQYKLLTAKAAITNKVVATASLPAAAAAMDGTILIEDNGTGDRNLIVYAGGQRFRIDGGAAI